MMTPTITVWRVNTWKRDFHSDPLSKTYHESFFRDTIINNTKKIPYFWRSGVSRGKLLQYLANEFIIFLRDLWLRRTGFLIFYRDFHKFLRSDLPLVGYVMRIRLTVRIQSYFFSLFLYKGPVYTSSTRLKIIKVIYKKRYSN